MNCSSCLRFWRWRAKRQGKPLKLGRTGTCMLDGSKTHEDLSCGYHSNLVPVKSLEEVSPDKRDQV